MKQLLMSVLLFGLVSCASQPEVREWTLTYVGSYEEVTEMEDPLSCFCFNGGYLDACGGGQIALCFEGDGPAEGCRNIEVSGRYVDADAEVEGNDACPEEVFRYLLVETWHCMD